MPIGKTDTKRTTTLAHSLAGRHAEKEKEGGGKGGWGGGCLSIESGDMGGKKRSNIPANDSANDSANALDRRPSPSGTSSPRAILAAWLATFRFCWSLRF